jgi:hypothetical protein
MGACSCRGGNHSLSIPYLTHSLSFTHPIPHNLLSFPSHPHHHSLTPTSLHHVLFCHPHPCEYQGQAHSQSYPRHRGQPEAAQGPPQEDDEPGARGPHGLREPQVSLRAHGCCAGEPHVSSVVWCRDEYVSLCHCVAVSRSVYTPLLFFSTTLLCCQLVTQLWFHSVTLSLYHCALCPTVIATAQLMICQVLIMWCVLIVPQQSIFQWLPSFHWSSSRSSGHRCHCDSP